MRTTAEIYWHVYTQDQVKPELRGNLIYILEVPSFPGSPILRDIFDPTGRQFPSATAARLRALIDSSYHGIMYRGVNKAAVYDVMLQDPVLLKHDPEFAIYNKAILAKARDFFLKQPQHNFNVRAEQVVAHGTNDSRLLGLRKQIQI